MTDNTQPEALRDARLNDLSGGIAGALVAVEKEREQEVRA